MTGKRLIIVKKKQVNNATSVVNRVDVVPARFNNGEVLDLAVVHDQSSLESVKVQESYTSGSVLIDKLSAAAEVSDLSEILKQELVDVCHKIVRIVGWNVLRDWCEETLASFCLDYTNPVGNVEYVHTAGEEGEINIEFVDANGVQQVFHPAEAGTEYVYSQDDSVVAYQHEDIIECDEYEVSSDIHVKTQNTDGVYSQDDSVVYKMDHDVIKSEANGTAVLPVRTQRTDIIGTQESVDDDMADVIVLQYGEDIETEEVDILGDEDEDNKDLIIVPYDEDDSKTQMIDESKLIDAVDLKDVDLSNMCQKVFRQQLSGPVRHLYNRRVFNPERPYGCLECRKAYRKISDLHLHQKTHTGELCTVCAVCGKQFSRLESLKRHQVVHNEEKFKCEQCDKSFASKEGRHRHVMSTHKIEESPFVCTRCGKKCCSAYELKKHETWCRGDRPYGCSYCGKRFAAAGNLRTHEMIHTGERPYGCTMCERRFVSSSYVKVHVRQVHSDIRPYKCMECDKSFAVPQVLKLHQLVHTGIRPYPCNQCGKKLSSRSAFKGHQAMHVRAATGALPPHPRRSIKRATRDVERLNL